MIYDNEVSELLRATPYLRENPEASELSVKSLKKVFYNPYTSYGEGRLLHFSMEGYEFPWLPGPKKPLESMLTFKHEPGKISLDPRNITSESLHNILRESIKHYINLYSMENLSDAVNVSSERINFFLSGGVISYNDGYEIECYLTEHV